MFLRDEVLYAPEALPRVAFATRLDVVVIDAMMARAAIGASGRARGPRRFREWVRGIEPLSGVVRIDEAVAGPRVVDDGWGAGCVTKRGTPP